jgi:hypothetical protein
MKLKKQEKKSKLGLLIFHVGSGIQNEKCSDPDLGLKNVWICICEEKIFGSGSRIKHPGSVTLIPSKIKTNIL